MPQGPKGERRPAGVNARAVMIANISTGEIDDRVTPSPFFFSFALDRWRRRIS
jgi:hypothetical protein